MPRFDALRDRLAPGVPLSHVVRPDWLALARDGQGARLAAPLARLIADAGGPVLCTCTTLGPLAEGLGAIRVDRPLMQAAAAIGGRLVLAYALESTAQASCALLRACSGPDAPAPRLLDLSAHWPRFEAGDAAGFAEALAQGVRDELARAPADAVILAQVSMSDAADLLGDCGCPVLSAPARALTAALARLPGAS